MGMHDDRAKLEDPNAPHSLFSASGSSGWTRCPDFLNANYGEPDTAGKDAAFGTVCHSIVEESLAEGRLLTELEGETRCAEAGGDSYCFEIDETTLGYVNDCLLAVADLPGERFYETRVTYDDLTPIRHQGGTCDYASCEPGKLYVRDWKFGTGVKVFVKGNPQVLLYAYGFFREWDWCYGFQEIDIAIIQPRLGHFDHYVVTREELLQFADWVRERAFAAWERDAPRIPGPKQCQWCKIAVKCAANVAVAEAMADELLDDVSEDGAMEVTSMSVVGTLDRLHDDRDYGFRDPKNMDTASIAKFYRWRKTIEAWFRKAGETLLERHDDGEEIDGYKSVEGRSKKKFVGKDEAVERLIELGVPEESCYKKELLSPAQAAEQVRLHQPLNEKGKRISKEKAAKMIAGVVVQPPGARTLVPVSDDREALPDDGDYLDDEDDL